MFVSQAYGTIYFTNFDASMVVKEANSKIYMHNADKIVGWSEFSIVKKFGKEGASSWVESYPDGVLISQEGSQEPNPNLVVSNSNAINYGIKNNSNAIVDLANNSSGGVFSVQEKADLLEDVRTTSNAFLYCCKNTSNALTYGLKNNSNVIISLLPGAFSEAEKLEVLEDVRTTSNAFLYCCKNTSNALSYGLRNNSNVIVTLSLGTLTELEKSEIFESARTTSNAFLYCCKNTSNALVYGIKNNSNAIRALPVRLCGCCDGCEPVARSEEPLDGAQGERGRDGHVSSDACSGCFPSSVNTRIAAWSLDNKYLAIARERDAGEGVLVYACDFKTEALTRVAHISVIDGVHVYSVAWGTEDKTLAIGVDDVDSGKEIYLYAFDKETNKLELLPDVDQLLRSF